MKKSQVLKLIKQGEGLNVEFKSSLSDPERIAEIASSFANAKGGIVFIGVSDDSEIKGIEIGRNTIERLTDILVDNSDPKIYPEIKHRIIQGKGIISVSVKESPDKPHLAFGKAFIRIGKNTKPMSRGEYERILIGKHGEKLRFDNQPCKRTSLKDIDENKLRGFLKTAKEERNLDINLKAPVKEILKKLKLIQNDKLTNAAILMFGEDPKRFFLQAEVRCARFKGTEAAKPFIDMQVIEGSILDQIDEVERFVLRNISKAAWVEPGKMRRQEKWEYPPDAIREAIINAVCHRDYKSTANVQVRIFDDRLEVWNPGSLPEGWTVENLKKKHESKPHNPLIADCFFLVKLIERWGTGTIEMARLCKSEGLPSPEFEDTGSSIITIFKKSNFIKKSLEEMTLNERQNKTLDYLGRSGAISRKEYAAQAGISLRQANKDLRDMLEKKLVVQIGKGRSIKYISARLVHD